MVEVPEKSINHEPSVERNPDDERSKDATVFVDYLELVNDLRETIVTQIEETLPVLSLNWAS